MKDEKTTINVKENLKNLIETDAVLEFFKKKIG